jgi:hypothetical protein
MSFRRVGWLGATALSVILWASCGEVFRPVVIPVSTTPPNPSNFHAVFGLTTNVSSNPGSALQIDVAGDSNIGVANMGANPTHAAILPNNSRVFVASAGSVGGGGTLVPGGVDLVTAFTPAGDSPIATGLGTPTVFTLPNVATNQSSNITSIGENVNAVTVVVASTLVNAQVGGTIVISGVVAPPPTPSANSNGYDGAFTITSVNGTTITFDDPITGLTPTSGGTATIPIPLSCSYQPDFLATAQTTAVYLANYGSENNSGCNVSSTDSVAILSTVQNSISNIAYFPGTHPVGLVETPDNQNLYVLNQGTNTVVDLSPLDLSVTATIPLPAGSTNPAWATARVDSLRVYVVTQGDGKLFTINTATNVMDGGQSVGGAGANFVLYDNTRNRLYVTNPTAGSVYVFDATTDSPTLMSAISMTTGANAPCPNGCFPVSVTVMPDGSRFYVASYQTPSACPDPAIGAASACLIPMLTVFDARSMTVKPIPSSQSPLAPSLALLAAPQFASGQYAVPLDPTSPCSTPAIYIPGSTRFRMFTTASADSSHVYVGICDAGTIADINATTSSIATGGTNTPDTLMTDLAAPFSAAPAGSNGQPPPQNPILLLTGQ